MRSGTGVTGVVHAGDLKGGNRRSPAGQQAGWRYGRRRALHTRPGGRRSGPGRQHQHRRGPLVVIELALGFDLQLEGEVELSPGRSDEVGRLVVGSFAHGGSLGCLRLVDLAGEVELGDGLVLRLLPELLGVIGCLPKELGRDHPFEEVIGVGAGVGRRSRAGMACRSRVTAGHGAEEGSEGDQGREQDRIGEHDDQLAAEAVHEEQPDVDDHQGHEGGDDDHGLEQHGERPGDCSYDRGGQQGGS